MIIWGARTGLRRFEERLSQAELERLYAWSCDPELLRWSGGAPLGLSFQDFCEHLLGEQRYGPHNRRAFLILRRDTLELIGRLGLFSIDWDHLQSELGIVIGEKNYWGQGFGRDAVRTLLGHVFRTTRLERIYLFTFTQNARAQRAFAAVGFRVVRPVRRALPDVGEFDGLEMEITRREFLSAARPQRTTALSNLPSGDNP